MEPPGPVKRFLRFSMVAGEPRPAFPALPVLQQRRAVGLPALCTRRHRVPPYTPSQVSCGLRSPHSFFSFSLCFPRAAHHYFPVQVVWEDRAALESTEHPYVIGYEPHSVLPQGICVFCL